MHKLVPVLVRINRANILVFGSILFLPANMTRPWIPLLGAISLIPPLTFSLFFSIEILVLLRRNYEFWFVSVLNVVNWVGIAIMFGDFRAVVCISFWLNSQNIISIDANYRTYQTTVKSIIMAGPSMLAMVFCCSYRLIVDSMYPSFTIGTVTLHWRQIVIFSASTLIIFMFKKAYAKVRRRRRRVQTRVASNVGGDRHTISCVVIRARTRLAPLGNKSRLRLTNFIRKKAATASSKQQLRLGCHGSFIVDSRNILLSQYLLERLINSRMQRLLYVFALLGLVMTATTWSLLLNSSEYFQAPAIAAFILVFVSTSTSLALSQKDLLRLLLRNFDVLFSTFQATVLALCLMDLLQWEVSSILAVLAWWLWFLWIIMLDALTPSITHQLRLREFALLVVFVVLLVAGSSAACIAFDDRKIFKPRVLFTLTLPELGTYHESTEAFAVQRVVTLIGWNARLLLELAFSDPNQLIFICRRVEYSSPFLTFSEPLLVGNGSETKPSRRFGWKLAVVPLH
ncbi:hypothetical protein P3T76_013208 [Phytophthora citrophthora]|uniref:Transmembrane protein n=1 Tax=Phytophthora citrophthora TaxID=4793 RepID=A0AAD9G4R5_9STRA|nr:hypothetical protein P3T76_013208 [Phytophthora citrophthora]